MKHTFIFKSLLLAVLLCTAGVMDMQAKGTSVVESSVGGGSGSISGAQSSNASSPITFTFYAYPSTGYHVSSWSAWKSTSSGCEPKWCQISGGGTAWCNWAYVQIDWGSGYTAALPSNRHHGYVRVWFEPNTYTIWSNANGGNSNSFGTVYPTYDSSNYYSWGGAGRTGYKFDGWWDHPTGGNQVYWSNGVCRQNTGYWNSSNCWCHDGNVTIYAHWIANNYTVTFNTNGGSCTYQNLGVTYDATTNYNVSGQNPTRTGYTFAGWYTAANGGTQVYDAAGKCVSGTYWNTNNQWKYANHLTVYAHWTPNVYTVDFDKNADDASISSLSKQVTYDATYGTLPTTERNQYSFAGWFTGKEDGTKVESTTKVAITANQTLYGHWSKRVNENVTPTGVQVVEFTNHGTTTDKDIQEDMDDSQVPDGVVVVDLTKVENMDNPNDIVNVVRNHSKATPSTFIIVNDNLKNNITDDNKENVLFRKVDAKAGGVGYDTTYTCANFSATDGVNLKVPYEFTADAATYNRSNSSRWGTICVPFQLKSDDRIQYYTSGTSYNGTLVLNKTATVEAGKPAIYCVSSIDASGSGGATQNKENLSITYYERSVLQAAGVSGDAATIKLVGTFTELKIDDANAGTLGSGCDIYYYENNKFYKRSSGQTVTIPALRAYILIATN